MKEILLFFSFLFILSCTKGDLLVPDTSASQNLDTYKYNPGGLLTTPITSASRNIQYKLTVGANEGGSVSFGETSLRRRSGFYIYRPAGTEVTVTAEPNEGYEFSGWSNGWIGNPVTWKLNSNVGFSAEFKTTDD